MESERSYALPKINGRTIDLDMKYNYRSPYLESKVGTRHRDRKVWKKKMGLRLREEHGYDRGAVIGER